MNYEISKGTLAVVPNECNGSLIYEDKDRYIVKQTPYQVMESSCLYFGSSYKGRKEGTKNILGAEYKVPIIVDDSDNIIVFPTTSPLFISKLTSFKAQKYSFFLLLFLSKIAINIFLNDDPLSIPRSNFIDTLFTLIIISVFLSKKKSVQYFRKPKQ